MFKSYLFAITIFLSQCASCLADPQPQPMPLQTCAAQVPWGMPTDNKATAVVICRHAYVVQYDTVAKVPVWVAYTLTPDHAIGCVERSNSFAADQSLPSDKRSTPDDYAKSGYDIGHMGPDGDFSWNPMVEHESFILSNMSPQYPGVNRATWKIGETYIRIWAYELKHPLTVYVGPIYSSNDKTIGENHVIVPHAFYKIVVDDVNHEIIAWVMPQLPQLDKDITRYRASVASIVQQTGIQFPLPSDAKELANDHMWPANSAQFLHDKQAACHK
jgi:endonuclease G, mitochondrial